MVLNKVLSDCASRVILRPKITNVGTSHSRSSLAKFPHRLQRRTMGGFHHQWEKTGWKDPCLHCIPGLDQTGTHGEWQIPTTSSMWHAQQRGFPSGKQWICCNRSVCASITCVFAYIAVVNIRLDTVCVLLWSINKLFNFTAVYQYRKVKLFTPCIGCYLIELPVLYVQLALYKGCLPLDYNGPFSFKLWWETALCWLIS